MRDQPAVGRTSAWAQQADLLQHSVELWHRLLAIGASMGDYVTGMGATRGATAPPEGADVAYAHPRAADGLQRATAADLATWLPDDLLVKFDRVSMAHSLEGRAPYLSPPVVEAGLALPLAQRMNGAASKVALRRVASRWLPPVILERPKQGFVLPMARWLTQWFEKPASIRDYCFERAVPGLDMAAVARLTQDELAEGVRRERLLFALVLLIEWHQAFTGKRGDLARTYRDARLGPRAGPGPRQSR